MSGFRRFYGEPADYCILALLPGYLERPGWEELASLVRHPDFETRLRLGGDPLPTIGDADREAVNAKPFGGRHRKNTYASETPFTDGERIYASFGQNVGLFVFTMDGKPLWKKQWPPQPIYLDFGTASSPVVHDGLVYVNVDDDQRAELVALDAKLVAGSETCAGQYAEIGKRALDARSGPGAFTSTLSRSRTVQFRPAKNCFKARTWWRYRMASRARSRRRMRWPARVTR